MNELVSGRAELDSVEAMCGKIVRPDPELVNAFAEVMSEALVRRQLKQQKKLAHSIVDVTLNVYRRREHAIRSIHVKPSLRLASERVPVADVIDDLKWNMCGGLATGGERCFD